MSKRERIDALEARVAALEASNTPGGLGDAPDNTPGGDMCEAVCRACQGSGYADYAAVPCPACETVPPEAEPVPQWRAMVETGEAAIWRGDGTISAGHALSRVLHDTATLASGEGGWQIRTLALARIVAVAEGQVGDGWKADPDRCGCGPTFNAWTLLGAFRSRNIIVQSAPTPDDWEWLGVVAAAWLRSLLDGAS